MNRNKLIGVALLLVGGIALYFGFNAANAPVEELTEAVTGRYSDKTMLHLIGGAVAGIAGLVMLLRK